MTSLQLDLLSPRWRVQDLARNTGQVLYSDPFVAAFRDRLDAAGPNSLAFDEATWGDETRGAVGLDVESFSNFFAICFKRFADGKRLTFEKSDRTGPLDIQRIVRVLENNTIVTFNGATFDLPIVMLALRGASIIDLKMAVDNIIHGDVRRWDVERELGVRNRFNHIDLMECNPSVRSGLKTLAGRLHTRFLIDLPCDPNLPLTAREMNLVTLYCQYGDLDATEALYRAMREPLQLRVDLAKRYGLSDLRSRSDAQIGEAIVKKRIGGNPRGSDSPTSQVFAYEPPAYIRFETPILADFLEKLRQTTFAVNAAGKAIEPPMLNNLIFNIGNGAYSVGIGGLHSTEANRAVVPGPDEELIDVDVASQYPTNILNLGLYPDALGPRFLEVYREIIDERLAAKAAGDKVADQGLKIAINGVYGKLGSPFSALYSPKMMIATTMTGQLTLLMLIEALERAGARVVSANTDGVTFLGLKSQAARIDEVIATWELRVGCKIEKTRYRAIYASSVNTYIAIKEDGKVKHKGPLSDPWTENDVREQMKKNPQMTVLTQAAIAFLRDGTSIEDTVYGETDLRRFVTVIKVTSGAKWRNYPLGRVVRYYWSTDGDPILTKKGGRVAKTDGARPLVEIVSEVPHDLDRLRYCEATVKLLNELGVTV